ncbi:hypothetical protein ABEB36_006448 [Hypothenemus hampei]|uniref:Guanine nucleotide-binding protein subunit beta-like protein 1 n=1 Tax=Hypothenemus hampei TaxID=57062 RepID=A0ABD1EQJ3_HYPHA
MITGIGILPPDPLYCFKENMGPVHCICFPKRNPDYSDLLLAGTENGDVYFFDLECNRLQYKKNMGESIQAIHSREYDIITQEKSGLIKLWSIENNSSYNVQKTFHSYGGFCRSIFEQDKRELIFAQETGRLEAIDLNNFQVIKQFVPGELCGNPMCLETFQYKGTTLLFVGYESGHIILYDYNTAKQCCQLKLNKELITSVTFDPNTLRGVVASSSDTLEIIRLNPDCLELVEAAELPLPNSGCQVVKFRPDHKLFMAGGWDGRLRIYSWRTLRTLVILTEHKKQISDIQFSPAVVRNWESKIFASGGADGTIALWNVYHSYTY